MQQSLNKLTSLVYMVPLRRCGSHAIRLRLNQIDDFNSPYPLHEIDLGQKYIDNIENIYGDISDNKNYFGLIQDLCKYQAYSLVPWEQYVSDPMHIYDRLLLKQKQQNSENLQQRGIKSVINELYHDFGAQRGISYTMDKSLESNLVFETPKNSKFINLVRDPRAQISSINKAIIHNFDTLLNAQLYYKMYNMVEELENTIDPENILTIRYEDFIDDETLVIDKIKAFIGLDSDCRGEIYQNSEAKILSKRSALWENNFNAPIVGNVDKYLKSLSMDEIELIESVCGDFMDKYGYEKITDIGNNEINIDQQTINTAMENNEKNKIIAWQNLKNNNFKDYVLRKKRFEFIQFLTNQ